MTGLKRGRKTAKVGLGRTAKSPEAATAEERLSDAIKTALFELRQRGFNRLFQRGEIFEFSTPESLLEIDFAEPVFVLVDRLLVTADSRARIVDAAEISFRESGEVIFETAAREGQDSRQMRSWYPVDARQFRSRSE